MGMLGAAAVAAMGGVGGTYPHHTQLSSTPVSTIPGSGSFSGLITPETSPEQYMNNPVRSAVQRIYNNNNLTGSHLTGSHLTGSHHIPGMSHITGYKFESHADLASAIKVEKTASGGIGCAARI